MLLQCWLVLPALAARLLEVRLKQVDGKHNSKQRVLPSMWFVTSTGEQTLPYTAKATVKLASVDVVGSAAVAIARSDMDALRALQQQ